jgi:Uma2 family endonuclease
MGVTRAVGESLMCTRRWTRREYDRLIELGMLDEDEPIELLAGRMVVREPQRTPHAVATQLAAEALRVAFGAGWTVRVQLPLALDAESEPEPDVAVVRGGPRDHLREHPSRPALVVEVARDSLRVDRALKAHLYARAGIEDYWIVNLVDRVLEVRRVPTRPGSRRGAAYAEVRRFAPSESIAPLAAPSATIAVADLLP